MGNLSENRRGVAIYVREDISAEKCEPLNNLPCKESSGCKLRINRNEKLLNGGFNKSPSSDIENHENLFNSFLMTM